MNTEMIKNEIMAMLNTLKSDFREVSGVAWDNRPDADEESMDDFRSSMDSAEKEFNETFDAIVEKLGAL